MKPMTLMAITAMSLGSLACKKTDTTAKNVKSQEVAMSDTDRGIAQINEGIRQKVIAEQQTDPEGLARRDAHPKAHGCVKAEFKVNATLSPDLQTRLLQPGATYPAWIRFSNSTGMNPDQAPDGRGMALKVMNVPGETILTPESGTHDFIMINAPVFFIAGITDYLENMMASAMGTLDQFFAKYPSSLEAVTRIRSAKVFNPLHAQYFSMVPYKLNQHAIKFSAKPCTDSTTKASQDPQDPNFLRQAMVDSLKTESSCFDFMIQKQGNPDTMPIEDPRVEWDRKASPFQKVATLTVLKQEFDTPENATFCRDIAFNPWNALPEHEPLGTINLIRKVVYQSISTLRHELNQ